MQGDSSPNTHIHSQHTVARLHSIFHQQPSTVWSLCHHDNTHNLRWCGTVPAHHYLIIYGRTSSLHHCCFLLQRCWSGKNCCHERLRNTRGVFGNTRTGIPTSCKLSSEYDSALESEYPNITADNFYPVDGPRKKCKTEVKKHQKWTNKQLYKQPQRDEKRGLPYFPPGPEPSQQCSSL